MSDGSQLTTKTATMTIGISHKIIRFLASGKI